MHANLFVPAVEDQERLWRETVDDTPATEAEARRGGVTSTELYSKMLHDISSLVSRLVAKSNRLIGNHTTNLAECWMHIRTKFDGGKVINRSQSGSWEHRLVYVIIEEKISVLSSYCTLQFPLYNSNI